MASTDTARLWEQLLEYVEEGRVIPIVGQDLLRVTFEGREVLLYRLLAERLARRLDVPGDELDDTGGLNTVACRYLARGGELEDIYSALKVVMPPTESLGPCDPLRKLAAVTPFHLFTARPSTHELFPGGGAEFVDELHRRWVERHPSPGAEAQAAATVDPRHAPLDMERGAVFLSYASEDRAAVERIQTELEGAGIDTWFDRRELALGDLWQAKIKRNVENCSFFVPVLSRHTVTRERRYFRAEWRYAESVALQVPSSMKFILPVAIDATMPTEPTLPESFRDLQWARLSDGRVTPEFVGELKQLFREYHRTRSEA